MSSLLIAFAVVMLVPLFVANWRVSLAGLGWQGVLLAWIAFRLHGADPSAPTVLRYLDLVLLRAVVGPVALWTVLTRRNTPGRNDMLPPNMLAWATALAFVMLGFRLARVLVPVDGDERMIVGLAAGAALLGFLVLSTQVGPLSQMVGVLRIENAIALLELLDEGHGDLGLQAGQSLVYACSIGMFWWYLSTLDAPIPTAERR